MTLLLTLACAPSLYSETTDWVVPENGWPAADTLPDGFSGEGYSEGDTIPELSDIDQNGDTVSLWQFYGQVVILDISTMWCAPCQELAADVKETQAHYADDGLVYVTVLPQNIDGDVPDLEDLQFWADSFRISSPVLRDGNDWYLGAVPTSTFPQIMVLDRELKVVERDITATDPAIRAVVDAFLAAE